MWGELNAKPLNFVWKTLSLHSSCTLNEAQNWFSSLLLIQEHMAINIYNFCLHKFSHIPVANVLIKLKDKHFYVAGCHNLRNSIYGLPVPVAARSRA